MKYNDISEIELFKPTLEFIVEGEHFDLHNDFKCISIGANQKSEFVITFRSINAQKRIIYLAFLDYQLLTQLDSDPTDNGSAVTIGNFQRCKYEMENSLLKEDSVGRKCYLIQFEEGFSIELLAQRVLLFAK